ncbi:MAG: ISAs1 family transposase [Nanoarchaeota archaeon]|nr:ISAs1 family transposase [Nanoarchaeota archaeon]
METFNEQRVYANFSYNFANFTDCRQQHKVKHLLIEILYMAILATIAGAEDIEDIARYSTTKKNWLSTFLTLPKGIPSHDTFNRVLCMIDPTEFGKSFIGWISAYRDRLPMSDEKDVIPIDGKTICNSNDDYAGKKAIHMVSAMSTKYGLVLGQKKCAEKSNEITAIPELLDLISVKSCIVTIDAMGCQKKIAEKIISKGADYILALKGNQGNLHDEIVDFFEKTKQPEFKHYIYQTDTQTEKNHGRIETRQCSTVTNLDWLLEPSQWTNLKTIVKINATVIKGNKETTEDRYYITSIDGNATLINQAIRTHWHIENKLHWVLDVIFREDYCRLRAGNGAENMNIIRKIALNKLKSDTSYKCSIKGKKKRCGWDDNYAAKILWEMTA